MAMPRPTPDSHDDNVDETSLMEEMRLHTQLSAPEDYTRRPALAGIMLAVLLGGIIWLVVLTWLIVR